jgi:hypothetical protein
MDPELKTLIEDGREIPALPDIVRARSLSRARATLAASARASKMVTHPPGRHRMAIAMAASIAFVLGAAAVAAVQWGRSPTRSKVEPAASTPVKRSVTSPAPESSFLTEPQDPIETSLPRRTQAGRPASVQESYAAETNLLARAQVAYTTQKFLVALALVAEHGRKFPNGRLTEEREALRVRALSGAGHTEDSRRAAASFARRFPRSVLLPRTGEIPK